MRAILSRFLLALALVFAPALSVAAPAWAQAINLNQPKDTTAVSVTTTATKLMASPATAARTTRGVFIQPTNGDIYVGGPSVTSSTGLLITSGTIIFVEWSQGDRWFARTASGTVDVRVLPVY